MDTKSHLIEKAGIICFVLFFASCKKEKPNLNEPIQPAQTQKIQNEPTEEPPLIQTQQEQVDAYSKRFDISEKQSADLIGRESLLIKKLKTLSLDGSNGPEIVAELTTYCTTLRHFLASESISNNTKRIARLSPEFLKDVPKGQPTKEFLAQLDSLKIDGIPDKYNFEIRAIMGIINAISRFRPDLLPYFLIQQAAIFPPSMLDSIVYSAVLETALEHKVIIQKGGGITGFQSLRDAPNPVYRLLAVKMMSELEQNSKNLADFYASYITEQDPLILGIVVQQLLKIDTPEVTSIIGEIQNSEALKSQPDVEMAIKEMIQRHTQK
jgi:hypothetical protein